MHRVCLNLEIRMLSSCLLDMEQELNEFAQVECLSLSVTNYISIIRINESPLTCLRLS